jgi:hypothetical protein
MRLLTLLLLCLIGSPLLGGIITNGTFDSNTAGWVFTASDGNYWWSNGGNPGGFAVLNNGPGPVPTMTQTVSLIIGHTYQLTWDMISAYQYYGSDQVPGAGASIDGHLWEYPVWIHQWLPHSVTFVASNASADLSFSAQRNGTDSDAGIDNVTLTDLSEGATIPEPATLSLLGAGLAAFLIKRSANRRRPV